MVTSLCSEFLDFDFFKEIFELPELRNFGILAQLDL